MKIKSLTVKNRYNMKYTQVFFDEKKWPCFISLKFVWFIFAQIALIICLKMLMFACQARAPMHEVPPWRAPKGNFLTFRSSDRRKMYFLFVFFYVFFTPSFWLSDFSWNFEVLWGASKKSWLERYTILSFMYFCKYVNQRKSNDRWIE